MSSLGAGSICELCVLGVELKNSFVLLITEPFPLPFPSLPYPPLPFPHLPSPHLTSSPQGLEKWFSSIGHVSLLQSTQHGGSQPSLMPVPGSPVPSSTYEDTRHAHGAHTSIHTCMQTFRHKISKSSKTSFFLICTLCVVWRCPP